MDDLLGYLRDAAQGASNAAASNVSGPVDLLAWLLRKGGVPVPENALGGSQWMAERGLTAKPKNALAGLAGETLGMVGPIVAAAKAPQIANALLKAGENAAARPMLNPQTGAIVWHGSPHKFDAFDGSKIGTGEGAQAYGHGLYLADAPEVAKDYAKKLSSAGLAKHALTQSGGQIDDAIAQASQSVQNYQTLIAKGGGGDMRRANGMLALAQKKLADLQSMKAGALDEAGNLYKVDLPDEQIAKMLDWDKPLSQQAAEVRAAVLATKKQLTPDDIENLGGAAGVRALYDPANKIDNFLGTWQSLRGRAEAGESLLRQAGIPGIRYLDGGSRGAGAGTSNYVVFHGEENALRILERNGVPTGR